MLITITSEQKILATVQPLTAAGNPAEVDTAPLWSVTSGDATLEVMEGGMSAWIISGASNVNSQVAISADADLGPGFSTIDDVLDVAVVSPLASTLGVVFGNAVDK